MEKKFRRWVSVFIVALFLIVLTAGCARQPAQKPIEAEAPVPAPAVTAPPVLEQPKYPEPGNPELPLVTEEKTVTVWAPMRTQEIAAIAETLAYTAYFEELEKRTGITVEFIHPTAGREQESFNMIIAAGDLPDVMYVNIGPRPINYPGGLDKGIEDGIFFNITEYIRTYAPNYYSAINLDGDIRRSVTTDAGNVPGFFQIATEIQPPWFGGVVRKDWLDALEMEVPVTYDDWYDMLVAFRDEKGAVAPMMLNWTGFQPFNWFNAGYGVAERFFQVDGEVKFGPIESGYRDYLEMLAKWYAEGLIDRDFGTRRDFSSPIEFTTTGKTGAWNDIYTTFAMRKQQSRDPNFRVVGVPSPVINEGDQVHLRQTNYLAGINALAITTAAEDPHTIMKWLDYNYSPEGSLLANFGFKEGTHYEFGPDGQPRFTSFIYNNPDGLIRSVATGYFSRPAISGFLNFWRGREFVGLIEDSVQAPTNWAKNNDAAWIIPPFITLTADEGAEFGGIMADIITFVNENTLKFIMGAQSFDNYETNFVQQIKGMNIERAIELQQTALDRFNAR